MKKNVFTSVLYCCSHGFVILLDAAHTGPGYITGAHMEHYIIPMFLHLSETRIPDIKSCLVLCFIFKLHEFTPHELYFMLSFVMKSLQLAHAHRGERLGHKV